MTKKIEISKKLLDKLYLQCNLSTYKIAKKLGCDPSVIQKRLKEYKIKSKNPKEKINFTKEKLFDLYIIKKFSTQKISNILGISSCTVYNKLKEAGIDIRPKKIIKINRKALEKLYINNKLSCSEIAKKLGCNRITIFQKLRKFMIKTRNLSEANIIYPKKKFNGNNKLKAYMIGFRLGDLNVRTNIGETIFIKSNTTKKEQLDLIEQVYGGYGHFRVSQGKNDYCVWCNLDKSFSFLLPKEDKMEDWILNNNDCFFSFLAGYTDAEGNINVSQGRARFRIRTYDKNILFQLYNKLNSLGINTKFGIALKKGIHSGIKHNKDCWGIFVNSKESLLELFRFLKPLLRHKKRFNDLVLAENNILERNKKHRMNISLMENKKTFYITTPVYYANGSPHLGGAYTTIAADVLARWHKLVGEEVFFLTGTDEHGQKIQETAEKERLKPKEFVDKIAKEFKEAFKMLNISNDNFVRTTDKIHEEEVKKILQELYNKKIIYKGYYEAYYCVGCEQYLNESDLVDGKCPLHKLEPELRKEESYLFKLSSFQDKLLKLIKTEKYGIFPEARRKEIIDFIESGLRDISISRLKSKVSWGIELPFDKEHTCFVWVDAFWNYLTGLIEKKKFDKFWPANVQLMAKDIIRVHATIWPALLLATENKLPETLFVHGYFTIDGQKMSKSLGNVISPVYLTEKYGADSVRYYLMRNIPFGQDGDVSEESLINRHNTELANKLGNLISRVSALAEKYGIEKTENKLIKKLRLKEIEKHIDNFELDKALSEIFAFIDNCNEYVQSKKPWETHDKKVLYELADSIKAIGILLYPFMPSTSEKISKEFGFKIKLDEIEKPLKVKKIKKGEILFKKI
ncbi:MAG: methionine--tRNA ligase [Nanoarchaeota archaeon]